MLETIIIGLSVVLAIFSILDAISTYKALTLPGLYEANPVSRWIIDQTSIFGFVIVKALVSVLIIGVSFLFQLSWFLAPLFVIVIAGLAYAVWNNVKLIRERT